MPCILRIGGNDFDPAKFQEQAGLENAKITLKGELVNNRRPAKDSRIQVVTSRAGLDDLSTQIEDTIAFLEANRERLQHIGTTAGIEFAVVDFGVYVSIPYFTEDQINSTYFPAALMAAVGALGLGVSLSQFAYYKDWGKKRTARFLSRLRRGR